MFNKSKNNPSPATESEEEALDSALASTSAPAPAANGKPAPGSNNFLLDRNKPSVISEGFALVGDITAQGVLHVEGSIRVTVVTESINIGLTGLVEGRIECTSLQIKGAFSGQAQCRELVVSGKARIRGRVTYETLSIQRGAVVDGELICTL